MLLKIKPKLEAFNFFWQQISFRSSDPALPQNIFFTSKLFILPEAAANKKKKIQFKWFYTKPAFLSGFFVEHSLWIFLVWGNSFCLVN